MPVGINAVELLGFFAGVDLFKSIQKNYKFFVTIWDDALKASTPDPETGPMPLITHWHTRSVTIPQYTFSKEVVKYGPIAKSFPVMELNGLDIAITFEEDEFGTIAYFINWLQRKIIRNDGTYRSQKDNRVDNLMILTEDDSGIPINLFWYKNVYFQNASPATFDYGGNESIKYDITFGADYLQFLPIKALAKANIKTEIMGKILGV